MRSGRSGRPPRRRPGHHGRRPDARGGDAGRPAGRPSGPLCGRHAADRGGAPIPAATDASSAGPTTRSRRSSSTRTPPPSSCRSPRSTPASTSSTRTRLRTGLGEITADNAAGELLLTDVIAVARRRGRPVGAYLHRRPVADRGHQRPGAAGPDERRDEPPDRRGLDAGRSHRGRSGQHLDPRLGRPGARRHAAARNVARGRHLGRGRGDDRAGDHPHRRRGGGAARPSSGPTARSASSEPAPPSGRTRTCGRGPSSAARARSARSWRPRTPGSATGAKVPHQSYVGDAEIGERRQHRRRGDLRQLRRGRPRPRAPGRRLRASSAATRCWPRRSRSPTAPTSRPGSTITGDVASGRTRRGPRTAAQHPRLGGAQARRHEARPSGRGRTAAGAGASHERPATRLGEEDHG